MKVDLIGEFEFTHQPDKPAALVIHHLIRGYDVLSLDQAATAELRELLQTVQKRIRKLSGDIQVICGGGGDITLFTPAGQRACYLNADQAAQLRRLID